METEQLALRTNGDDVRGDLDPKTFWWLFLSGILGGLYHLAKKSIRCKITNPHGFKTLALTSCSLSLWHMSIIYIFYATIVLHPRKVHPTHD